MHPLAYHLIHARTHLSTPPPHTHLSLTHPSIHPLTNSSTHTPTSYLPIHPFTYQLTHSLGHLPTHPTHPITYLQRLYIWQMAMCLSSSVGKKVSRQLPFSNAGSVSANVELTIPKYSDVFIAAPNKFQIRPGTVSIQLGTSDPKVVFGSLTPTSTW